MSAHPAPDVQAQPYRKKQCLPLDSLHASPGSVLKNFMFHLCNSLGADKCWSTSIQHCRLPNLLATADGSMTNAAVYRERLALPLQHSPQLLLCFKKLPARNEVNLRDGLAHLKSVEVAGTSKPPNVIVPQRMDAKRSMCV